MYFSGYTEVWKNLIQKLKIQNEDDKNGDKIFETIKVGFN